MSRRKKLKFYMTISQQVKQIRLKKKKKVVKNQKSARSFVMFDCEDFSKGKQKKKLISVMSINSIPANAHNGVVAGENAKIVYVVYSTAVELETTNIWGVYDNLESAKKHFAYLNSEAISTLHGILHIFSITFLPTSPV